MLSYSLLFGAPYAVLGEKRVETMMELLNPIKGKKFVDIGSGDGRIVIAASNRGLNALGYEINPVIYLLSQYNLRIKKAKHSKIILTDFWQKNFSEFDYVSIWGTKHMVKMLEKKLLKELKPGAKVVSNHFAFPNWKYTKIKNDVYLYIK